jgi:glucose-1-phosphatase
MSYICNWLTGQNSLSHFFKETYFSHEIGKRKPDVKTFVAITEKMKVAPEKILFIDDSIQHIEGARLAGLNAILLEKNVEISSLFSV